MSAADSDFRHVLFLAHFNGANDGTTFTAVTGQTITRGANFVTKTGTKKYGSASAYAAGNGSLSFPVGSTDARWALGTNDFTIEVWVYLASGSSGTRSIFSKYTTWATNVDVHLEVDSSGYVRFYAGDNTPVDLISDSTLATNAWVHVAVTRTSNVFRLFIDGTVQTDSVTDTVSIENDKTTCYIGVSSAGNSNYWNGYLDDMRISFKSRYTANFTPPTEEFSDHDLGVSAMYPLANVATIARKTALQTIAGRQRIALSGLTHSWPSRALGAISGTITESLDFATWRITATDAATGECLARTTSVGTSYSIYVPTQRPVLISCAPHVDYSWSAASSATVGDLVVPTATPTTPYVYRCTTAGVTGGTQPTWGTTPGGTTSDGTAVWTCVAQMPQPLIQGPLVAS